MILSRFAPSGIGSGGKVCAEKAFEATPSIISFTAILNFVRLTRSSTKNAGVNSFSKNSESAAPILKHVSVPVFPNTASRTTSSIWAMY